MKRKLFACLLMLLAGAASLMAQTRVTGTITDNTGYGVIGASVIEKGTTNGAIADLDGKYEITGRPGATLVFSSIGYKEQEIVVGNQTVINVLLLEDTELLDEVVVVGYGTMKKSDLAGASVSMKEDQHRPVPPGPCGRCPGGPGLGCSGFFLLHPRPWPGDHQRQCRTAVRR